MPPDEPNEEKNQEQLAQDSETPFHPAGNAGTLDDTHPATDTNIQPEEAYDEGISGAAEANEPNTSNDVVDFTPPAPGTTIGPSAEQAHESSPPGQAEGGSEGQAA